MGISPTQTPSTYSIATFISSTVELFLRLPIETVLRRGQVQILSSKAYLEDREPLKTIVDVGQYRGAIGTMWLITREEGVSKIAARPGKKGKTDRPGQGIDGLWRGWRVGMWGLVGIWSVAAFGGAGSSGGEF
jgi:fusion and transport protein UGO1